MFSKRNRGPVPVQVVGTHPITKLEYYSKHGRNWFIALLVFSVIALVLGALIVAGVVHAKGYNNEIEALNTFVNTLPSYTMPLTDDAFGNNLPNFVHAVKDFVDANPNWEVIASNQDKLEILGNWLVIVPSIIAFFSIVGTVVFNYLYKLDRPVSTKKEQKFYRQLEKSEYRAAIKTQKINKAKANKELKANLKADFKSKKEK